MPVSVQIAEGLPRGVMLVAGMLDRWPGAVPYIYVDEDRHPVIVNAILRGMPSYMLVDLLIEHVAKIVASHFDCVIACLKGLDLLCRPQKATISNPWGAQLPRAVSSGYRSWGEMQARAARVYRAGLYRANG